MTPPKCRICGMREHNHRCQGGTPGMRVAEQQRLKQLGRGAISAPEATAPAITSHRSGDDGAQPGPRSAAEPKRPRKGWQPPEEALALAERRPRGWHDDTDSAGEPIEVREPQHRPARFYAPPGTCVYCDRRRDAARRSMRSVRERGTDA